MNTITVSYATDPAEVDAERLRAACDVVMNRLLDEAEGNDELTDPSVGGAMVLGAVEVTMTVAGTFMSCVEYAVELLGRATDGTPLAGAEQAMHFEVAGRNIEAKLRQQYEALGRALAGPSEVTTTVTTRDAQVSAAQVVGGGEVVYHAEPLGGVTYTVEPHEPTPRDGDD